MSTNDELLSLYWDIAYSEGKTGVSRGDEANEVLHKLRSALAVSKPEPSGKRAELIANLREWAEDWALLQAHNDPSRHYAWKAADMLAADDKAVGHPDEFMCPLCYDDPANIKDADDKACGEVTPEFFWLCEVMEQDRQHRPNKPRYVENKGRFQLTDDPYKAARFSDRGFCTAICTAAHSQSGLLVHPVEHGFDARRCSIANATKRTEMSSDNLIQAAEIKTWQERYNNTLRRIEEPRQYCTMDVLSISAMQAEIDELRAALAASKSEPSGERAEIVAELRADYCHCLEAYKVRGRVDPQCESCNTKDLRNRAADMLAADDKVGGEVVAHLWKCLGRWSAYLASNGEQANIAPPPWLVSAINAVTHPQPQAEALRVPDGWKLVPMEPTPEMIGAMSVEEATGIIDGVKTLGITGACLAYESMLAAAPSPKVQPGEQT